MQLSFEPSLFSKPHLSQSFVYETAQCTFACCLRSVILLCNRNLVFSCKQNSKFKIESAATRVGGGVVTRSVVLNHIFSWRLLNPCSGEFLNFLRFPVVSGGIIIC
jgi:hypothetical protein